MKVATRNNEITGDNFKNIGTDCLMVGIHLYSGCWHQRIKLFRIWRQTLNVHCRKIYKLCVRALDTGQKRLRIHFIFNDNVRIVCLSCNIRKFKTTDKLSEKSWKKRLLIVFNGVIYDVSAYTATEIIY